MKQIGLLLAVVLSILGTPKVQAQGAELFIPLIANQLQDISPAQEHLIDQIRRRPTTASITLVDTNVNALRGDSTRMSLPESRILNFSKSNIETRSSNDFT